jgi:hypothetical protein
VQQRAERCREALATVIVHATSRFGSWGARRRRCGAGTTLVRVETHYDPRGLVGRLMSALMAKRQFGKVRESALENLKRLAESGATAAA